MEALPPGAVPGGQKTYVFVDEYNRHKRLKVMRACDGCRKRKIRCDGALQNGPWPCGACLRLKLKCIPPTVDPDDDAQTLDGAGGPGQFVFSSAPAADRRPSAPPLQTSEQTWTGATTPIKADPSPVVSQGSNAIMYPTPVFTHQCPQMPGRHYSEDEHFTSSPVPLQYQPPQIIRSSYETTQFKTSRESSGDPQELDAAVRELSGHMGELAIDLSSAAPYITNEKRNLAEAPAVEEADVVLPSSVSSDLTVRIPPEMMPTEDRAMDYFGYFFEHVHPYVPVLNRQAFYEQWRVARHSISPLILEGIFACVARYLEDPIDVRRWLALAARHEESFKDVPRVTTIQALIILTKAREFVPKRGYYFRSWMTVKYMTTMAFDLGLHEHLDNHRAGTGCGLGLADCIVRTRMWQTLFGLEIWVGAPQGRTDFTVDHETVDFTLATSSADPDEFERRASRRITYLAQAVHNIKQTNRIWQKMRRHNPEWALDPLFVGQNEVIATWFMDLPSDMQIHYTDDDAPPPLRGDHFVANLHVYHYVIVMMQHRPQLQTLLEKRDPTFKAHLELCTQAASLMCRVHEALYRDFGLHGLQFMQRGIGFTIYCILTCIMMHLASITSPDPTTNSRARMFFTRHMRILELCAPSASPEVQLQISALREAFSQDTTRPFEIKMDLGLRSPASEGNTTPTTQQLAHSNFPTAGSNWKRPHEASSSRTMSPVNEYVPPFDSTTVPSAMPMATMSMPPQPQFTSSTMSHVTPPPQHQAFSIPSAINTDQTPAWDPSGIFQQWNTAFGQQPLPQPQHSSGTAGTGGPHSVPLVPTLTGVALLDEPRARLVPQPNYVPQTPANILPESAQLPTVTPMMWQDAFTNAYVSGQGHKRYRDESLDFGHFSKRRG